MLAASTGIVSASVVMMSVIALPLMLKAGYDKGLAGGTVAASGTLGQIIPPSVILIILGDVMNVSVGELFAGAILPGLLLVGLYIVYILLKAYLSPHAAPVAKNIQRVSLKEILISVIPPMLFIAMAMLGIFILGFFIDFIEISFIIVPILVPVMHAFGIDPVWFAVLIALNLQASFLTPPFGLSLFFLKGAAGDTIKTLEIYRGIIPFIFLQLLALCLVILFPDLVFAFL